MNRPKTIFWGAVTLDALKYVREIKLNMSDFQVLIHLMEKMDIYNNAILSQKEIADTLNLNPSTISRAANRLNSSQLITKIHGGI